MNLTLEQKPVKRPCGAREAKTLPDAVYCPHGGTCSTSGTCGEHELCPSMEEIGQNVIALDTQQPHTCPYRLSISCGEYCCCPRRYAIFQRTGS